MDPTVFPVLGLAREMPHEIPEILARVDALMDGLPYGIDLMLPSGVPQQASVQGLRESLPPAHVEFVEGLRQRFQIEPPRKPSFFTTQVRSESLFEAQIEAVLASHASGVATAIGLREDLIERARARGKLTFSLVGSVRHAQKALQMGVEVLVAQGHDAGGHTGPVGTMSLLPQIIAVAGDSPVLAANVHALMQSEPSKLRALPAAGTQFVYAGAKHALMSWRGRCAQGRSVAWLKQFLNA